MYARRFDASGEPLGGEIPVNTTTPEFQDSPAITFVSNGDFVIAWDSTRAGGPTAGSRIYARRFDSSGDPLSGEIPVNVTEATFETEPAISPDAEGGFTVAWASRDQDGSGWGVYARRFDESDAPQSGEIAVNTTTEGNQAAPAVAPEPEGGFAVAWTSEEPEESPNLVYFRRFNSTGSPLSSQIPVAPATGEGQFAPTITPDGEGGFDLAWQSNASGLADVYARRFDSAGVPFASAVLVDPASFYISGSPAIAAGPGGGFTVVWSAIDQCCVGPYQVYVTRFDATGTALSTAVRVDPEVPDAVGDPAVSTDGSGGFTVAWSRDETSIPQEDILARQLVPVPETTIDEKPPAITNDSTPTFAFNSDEFGSTLECKLDSGAFSSCASPLTLGALTDGHHTFEARATNPAEATDQTPAMSSFTIDTVAPNAQIDAGPSGLIDETEPTFSFSKDDPEATLECKLDLGTYSACSSPMTLGPQGDGLHSFSVRARDPAGNTSPTPASRSFTVDARTPEISFDSWPADGSLTNDATPSIGFEANEEATFECQIDSGASDPCSSPFTSEALSDGPHVLTVSATDVVGHTASASLGFTVDTITPDTSIEFGPEGPTRDPSPSFEFDSDEAGSTFECSLDGSAFSPCSSPFRPHLLPDGRHNFSVRASDEASNTDPTPATRAFVVDTTPLDTSIDSGPQGPTNDNTPSFGFSASEPRSTFECSLDAGAFSPCASPLTTVPLSDGSHSLSVRAIDQASNVDPSPAVRDFTIDTTAPNAKVSAKRKQPATRPIRIGVRCDEDCGLVASGRIMAGREGKSAQTQSRSLALGLREVTRRLVAGRKATVKLRLRDQGASRRLNLWAAAGKARAAIELAFSDAAGNLRTVKLTIGLSDERDVSRNMSRTPSN